MRRSTMVPRVPSRSPPPGRQQISPHIRATALAGALLRARPPFPLRVLAPPPPPGRALATTTARGRIRPDRPASLPHATLVYTPSPERRPISTSSIHRAPSMPKSAARRGQIRELSSAQVPGESRVQHVFPRSCRCAPIELRAEIGGSPPRQSPLLAVASLILEDSGIFCRPNLEIR
ncbi:putative formin-like protein 20 [Iris pallida]|uniref:Formin-like protein 20 n=1 Tax=Iris pallida TaxID=29817 RepID=A0AAX6GD62_IRIPA|nr:putative formin-like protein 20 [Iris pallida]